MALPVMDQIREELGKEWFGGTRVTNCVAHMALPLDARPRDCNLCRTDLENQFEYALRVNAWLNERLDKIREIANG